MLSLLDVSSLRLSSRVNHLLLSIRWAKIKPEQLWEVRNHL